MTTDTDTLTTLPPIAELTRYQATAPKFSLEPGYVPRGLPPAPELQWDGDEPYLPVGETGVRITPYRDTEEDYADCVSCRGGELGRCDDGREEEMQEGVRSRSE